MSENKNDFVEEFDYEKIMAEIRAEKEGKKAESEVKPYVLHSTSEPEVDEGIDGKTKMFSKISDSDTGMLRSGTDKPMRVKKEKAKKPVKKKTRKQRTIHTLIWVFSLLFTAIILASSIFFAISEVFAFFKDDYIVEIKIEEGTSIKDIAELLDENEIINSSLLFRTYIKVTGAPVDFQFGYHKFKPSYGYAAIISELRKPAERLDVVKVRIKEGMTVDGIAELMEENEICSAKEFITAVKTGTYKGEIVSKKPQNADIYYVLEGYLFPDTYQFYKEQKPEQVVQKLLDAMDSKYDAELRQKTKEMGWSYHEVLTLASIVELEASGYNEQMPKVAAVFLNRIEKPGETGGLLGSTPTMKYPYGNGKYDTNVYKGLPPGPLCSPSKAAIEAVLNRAENFGAYYYFVTDKNHEFYFTKNLSEHQAIIKKLKSKNLWEY